MKKPLAPGTAINAKRYKRWIERFGSYREGIINVTIQSWLEQFQLPDRDLAARVLDSVEFYGVTQIHAAYKHALAALPGWDRDPKKRIGNWRFAAMSDSAGESGDAMLYQFRLANGLDSKHFGDLFVSRSDLFRQTMLPEDDPKRLGPDDTIVLLDDFSGTGSQVCNAWNDPVTSFGALLAGMEKIYLVLVAASKAARDKILKETSIRPFPIHSLQESDNVFSEKCNKFSKADRTKLLHYCSIANKKHPKGFGDCGLVVVFHHRPPNNTIPILHASHDDWTGLFPRHD
jgi:hypothetical protein